MGVFTTDSFFHLIGETGEEGVYWIDLEIVGCQEMAHVVPHMFDL